MIFAVSSSVSICRLAGPKGRSPGCHGTLLSSVTRSTATQGSGRARSGAPPPPSAMKYSCVSCVETIARTRMLSVLLMFSPPVRLHLASRPATTDGSNTPVAATARSDMTSSNQAGRSGREEARGVRGTVGLLRCGE